MFDNIILGEATAQRLSHVIEQREQGVVRAENIVDSRYQDLMDDPLSCIEKIYAHFGMEFSGIARQRMQSYLHDKPKDKFGQHAYQVDERRTRDRPLFKRYQTLYDVPNEM